MREQPGKKVRCARGDGRDEDRRTCACTPQERHCWEWLYEDYHRQVRRFFRAHVDCPDDVDDLVQDVFARLIRQKHVPQGPGVYIHIAAQNRLRSYWRAKKRQRDRANATDGARAAKALSDPQADPLELLSQEETQSMIEQALWRLPEASARAVQLRIIQGLSLDEAARKMGCSHDALRKRLQRARHVLRASCEGGYGPQEHDKK